MADLKKLVKCFIRVFEKRNSIGLADLLDLRISFQEKHGHNAKNRSIDALAVLKYELNLLGNDVDKLKAKCASLVRSSKLEEKAKEVVVAQITVSAILIKLHCIDNGTASAAVITGLWTEAVNTQFCLLETLLDLYIELGDDNHWLLTPLKVVMRYARILSGRGDLICDPVKRNFLMKCKGKLDNVFRPFVKKKDPAKKMILLSVVINSIKVLFALQTINLSRNLIRQVEHAGFPKMELFPQNERKTYFYYVGRLLAYEDKLEEARGYFERALSSCSDSSQSHRRAILEYLIPINLCFGIRPSPQMLVDPQLKMFEELITLVRLGNVRGVDSWMQDRQENLVQKGLLLSLDTLKLLAYRNLFRNLIAVRELEPNEKATQVPLSYLLGPFGRFGELDPIAALFEEEQNEVSEEANLEHLQCILGNLIHKRLLKGYISHEKKIMVVAPKLLNAFPPIKVEQWWK